jgi:hypothetical protein
MSTEHVVVVSDVAMRVTEFDRWQATCSCGFEGNILPEEAADAQAAHHIAYWKDERIATLEAQLAARTEDVEALRLVDVKAAARDAALEEVLRLPFLAPFPNSNDADAVRALKRGGK